MLGWRHQLCQKTAQVRVISPKQSHVQQGREGAASDFTAGWRRRVGAKLPEATAGSEATWSSGLNLPSGSREVGGTGGGGGEGESETRVRRSG